MYYQRTLKSIYWRKHLQAFWCIQWWYALFLNFLLYLIYSVLSISAIQQSHPGVCMCVCVYSFFFTLFYIIFHHKCSDIVPWAEFHCLSSPNAIVCIYLLTPNSKSLPRPSPPSWQPQVCSPYPWVCFFSIDRFICATY